MFVSCHVRCGHWLRVRHFLKSDETVFWVKLDGTGPNSCHLDGSPKGLSWQTFGPSGFLRFTHFV